MPAACRRVLDVGCGAGHLGRLLKERGHHVTGMELVPEEADEARQRLDAVVTADVEAGLPFAPGSFDAVIFADLLEHLVDPWRVLREAAALLSPGGVVVASVPNVQNVDVVRRLLRGRWDYRERGILDRGHLRFFTLETIRRRCRAGGADGLVTSATATGGVLFARTVKLSTAGEGSAGVFHAASTGRVANKLAGQ